ncbi:MAG: SMC-Scp complex subunit ScpB [Actinomycetota bacterium]
MSGPRELHRVIEAILFVAEEPVSAQEFAQVLEAPVVEVCRLLAELASSCEQEGRGFVLRQVGGGYRFFSHPDAAAFLERFAAGHRASRLTQAALETLAVIAYRQPVSRGHIAEVRGVSPDSALRTLLARGLVQEVGRDRGPGLAILYGTTPLFLERLGLNALGDLTPLADLMPAPEEVERMESGLGPGL